MDEYLTLEEIREKIESEEFNEQPPSWEIFIVL